MCTCSVVFIKGVSGVPGSASGADAAGAARREYLMATGNPAPVLPFGVTLLGPAWSDEYMWGLAAAFAEKTGLGNGPAGHGVAAA